MKLAVLFNEPNIRKLQSQISAKEFMEWVAYDSIVRLPDPWLIAARLAHCINGVDMKAFIPTKKEPMTDEAIWKSFKKQATRNG